MTWKKVTAMEEIKRFVILASSGRYTHTELCADFGVSRKTGHKWYRRYREGGLKGCEPRSSRPGHCPQQLAVKIERLILRERRLHRTWGPKKLKELLRTTHRIKCPPACSTIARGLHRHGLSQRPRPKPGLNEVSRRTLTLPTHPNHVWTVDFKGWFLLGNGQRCDPLTVCDRFSRYVISCRARPNQQFAGTLRAFRKLMRLHGLPKIIRVDNGTPFASMALGRLSRLSVWWINQGIAVEFTRPASPQDNGSHERMHKDLKAEATRPASPTMSAQQRRFERWQRTYNYLRPHEGLCMKKPAQIYRRSSKRLREGDSALRYAKEFLVKRVLASGFFHHEGHAYHVGEIFANCRVGLKPHSSGQTEVYFANRLLGYLVFDRQNQTKTYIKSVTYVLTLSVT
jgi:transposase InsO family protein